MVTSNLEFDKHRKEKEKEEKKFGNSKPRHFPKEMAEAKKTIVCYTCLFLEHNYNILVQQIMRKKGEKRLHILR
jgi:predicted NUDIX family phosphoesterase